MMMNRAWIAMAMTVVATGCLAQVAKPMEDVNRVVDNTADSLNKAMTARIVPGTSRKGNNPVLFLIGNSTMRNGTLGNGNNGQWGWGYYAHEFFDAQKITVENQALGGMSSRTFYNRLWPDVCKGIKAGDWVIISIGHNDNGPYDSGRARASIPGIGEDSLRVTIKETGVEETVYTYGGYMRKYINDCKALGAHPILMSLTPRDAYDEQGKIVRVDKTYGLWAKQVAEQEHVPYVDLNSISADKLDRYGHWKEQYHFFTDHIHTSCFGAMMNARSAAEGLAESKDPGLAPLQAMMVNVALPTEDFTREPGKPVVFFIGDSTVKNADQDEDGMWGWGAQAYTVFNPEKITCVNAAKSGRSSRSFLNEGRWDKVYNSLQPGDYVLIEFGHNDICSIVDKKARGSIACAKDTCHVFRLDNGQYEVVYSFGWYLKKFIQDVREKGATPILVSLTPRNEWPNGKMERRNDTYGKWYREVVAETGVDFLDLHNIAADSYDKIGREKVGTYYKKDHTHTSLKGAQHNAQCVAEGLKRMKSPLAKFLLSAPAPQMEKLNRGVVALPAKDKGIFLSWRMLGTDSKDVCFDVERDGTVIAHHVKQTNYTDETGTANHTYRIITYQQEPKMDASASREVSEAVKPWADLYLSLPLDRPQGGVAPDGRPFTYTPNDCSVGDVDGDGAYEIILKWDPTNSHDNAHDGYTGEVIFDCYKLDGTKLWRINLGKNIRAGAHYTQFLVYDFDGDEKAEMVCKTSAGSVDGKGRPVSEAATDAAIRSLDNAADYRNARGRILTGPELLTVFSGETGEALHTVWYNPNRAFGVGTQVAEGEALEDGFPAYADAWGDHANKGNRGERYLACVAFLDGAEQRPSAVMCRGYYTRAYLWAVDFDGKELRTKWLHASVRPGPNSAYGQGAHNIAVGDVDGDGCDEITYGSAAIDHDGTLLYSTGLGHGDASHLGDLDPDRPGLEVFMVHEAPPYGSDLRDARTGEILLRTTGAEDTGRGIAADIDAAHRGCELWSLDTPGVRDIKGNKIGETWPALNFRIYWDGDLQDELLGNLGRPHFAPYLQKWNGKEAVPLPLSNGKQLHEVGNSVSCNWSKATPNLQADLFGDWREEVIYWDASDAAHLNIFTTNTPTDYRVPTLMHDHVYRMGVAWQNVCYNQPPHLGYYLPDHAERIR